MDVVAQGIVSLAEQGIADMTTHGTTCMAVQGITELVINSSIASQYNQIDRIKRNLVLVLLPLLLILYIN
jgi:hypothetical protein